MMKLLERFRIGVLSHTTSGHFVLFSLAYCSILAVPFFVFLAAQGFGTLQPSMATGSLDPGIGLTEAGYRVVVRLSIFSSVSALGALGAAISVISRVRLPGTRLDGIKLLELFSIQTVGAVFALILSLMFMGEMIAGSLFPHWSPFYRIIYSPPAFAKLLVWSFIAGFSERYVPGILDNLSKKPEQQSDITANEAK